MSETAPDVKTSALPLTCAEGHQIYAVYFPALKQYGFACGLCHTLGTTVTKGNQILAMRAAHDVISSLKEDLLLYTETKCVHLACGPKFHPLMVFQLRAGEGYAFGCIHCKRYSREVEDKGKIISVVVLRELEKSAPSVIIH